MSITGYNALVILNIYKKRGRTSYSIVSEVKRKLVIKKVGHAGTLDPLAEGVLIILTDKDTKKQKEFLNKEKTYITDIGFGIYTDTYDLEFIPEVVITSEDNWNNLREKLSSSSLSDIFKSFIGNIKQKAPIYSALSIKGQRLYKLARKGIKASEINLPERDITIYDIQLLKSYNKDIETDAGLKTIPCIQISVRCSSGTYIRSLIRDVAQKIGTEAVSLSIIRTSIGEYNISTSLDIDSI